MISARVRKNSRKKLKTPKKHSLKQKVNKLFKGFKSNPIVKALGLGAIQLLIELLKAKLSK